MRSADAPRLTLGRIYQRAFTLEGVNRERLVKAIGIPFLLLILCPVMAQLAGVASSRGGGIALGYVMLPILAALAVGVHRVVLLTPVDALASGEGFSPRLRRVALYAAALFGMLVVFMLAGGAAAKIVQWVMSGSPPRVRLTGSLAAGGIVGALALSRFTLLLPAIAVNLPRPLQTAWLLSRGNEIRLAFVLLALPWAVQAYFLWLFPRGTTWAQYLAAALLAALVTVVQAAAVSFSYRFLRASLPPPTHPPD